MPEPQPQVPPPAELHQRFSNLNWKQPHRSPDEIAELYGWRATVKSLQLIERAAVSEPRVTAEFLAAMPTTASPYKLDSRIKSPESLARKLDDINLLAHRGQQVDDLFRYTALTRTPNELVPAARHTIDALVDAGWKVHRAMHSYTDGSRYKGLHACLRTPGGDRVEVQFHSVASAAVKEATTEWYETVRSATSTESQRAEARRRSTEASAALAAPEGIDELTELGGRPVVVENYSDSRQQKASEPRRQEPEPAPQGERPRRRQRTAKRDGGIER
jgi:hypothetical protein